jgi:hypothetical protein
MNTTKLGNLLFAVGLLSGGVYATKRSKPLLSVGLYALGFGVGGFILGNSLTNFYSNK